MERYRQILTEEIIFNAIPSCIVFVCLIIALFFVKKILLLMGLQKYKTLVYLIIGVLILLNFLFMYFAISDLCLDLKDNSFVNYSGIVEYEIRKSSKYTDVYSLVDENNTLVETDRSFIYPDIQKCKADIIYARRSKRIVSCEVHEILETRLPEKVLW